MALFAGFDYENTMSETKAIQATNAGVGHAGRRYAPDKYECKNNANVNANA